MGIENQLNRARALIENEGDPVTYHGVHWFYLRKKTTAVKRALVILEEAGMVERWSSVSPDLVRLKGEAE